MKQNNLFKVGNASFMLSAAAPGPKVVEFKLPSMKEYDVVSVMGRDTVLVNQLIINTYGEEAAVRVCVWGLFRERYPVWVAQFSRMYSFTAVRDFIEKSVTEYRRTEPPYARE